jgi:hypothetical protein
MLTSRATKHATKFFEVAGIQHVLGSISNPFQDGFGSLETGLVHWGILSGRKSLHCTHQTVNSLYPRKSGPESHENPGFATTENGTGQA